MATSFPRSCLLFYTSFACTLGFDAEDVLEP
jgi:hypothetical protein